MDTPKISAPIYQPDSADNINSRLKSIEQSVSVKDYTDSNISNLRSEFYGALQDIRRDFSAMYATKDALGAKVGHALFYGVIASVITFFVLTYGGATYVYTKYIFNEEYSEMQKQPALLDTSEAVQIAPAKKETRKR